jgi:ribosome modulation factor
MEARRVTDAQNKDLILREKRRAELEETSFGTGTQGGALMQPRNGKELMDMANMMAGSGQMIRDFYRGNPGDCAGLIMICQPYGFNPFMVSWKTYKASKSAEAPVSFEGQLVNAMVNMSAPVKGRLRYSYDGEGPTRRCTVTGIDRETGEEITYTSPMLKDIKVKNSPLWVADPDQQLGYFSARSWARRHFPELLLGVYTREEIEEAPPRDITPRPAETNPLLARKLAAARGEVLPPEPEDVSQDPADHIEDAQEVEGHWTDGISTDDAFPGADEFSDGAKAFKAGKARRDCPEALTEQQRKDFLGGWDMARKAAE